MPHDTLGPPCHCGCGEGLPYGSTRKFKRGHAKRFNNQLADAYLAQFPQTDPTRGINLALPPDQQDGNVNTPYTPDPLAQARAYEELASQITDDPPADHPDSESESTPAFEVSKNVVKDIEGKVTFLLGMSSAMLASADPICVTVFQRNIPDISKAIVPLICQSPDMVTFFTKKGGFLLWINLGAACWPVIQTIIAHHLTKKLEIDPATGRIQERDVNQYRA